jgi:hypothetical protein
MIARTYRLFIAILAIIVIACFSGVQGQLQETPSIGYSTVAPSAAQNPSLYSQFYSMTPGPALSNPISAPQRFEIAGMPSTVYIGEQMQSVPYSQYLSSPAYTRVNSLWIKGATTWTQYAVVPQGATVSLFAISPTRAIGYLTSDGQIYSNNYVFYPNSLLTFYAGTIGRHTLSFAINGLSSNQVVIDVVGGTYTQPSNNPGYYQENNPGYYPGYYPGYSPDDYCEAGYHLDINGNCVPDQCNAGYHVENGYCVPNQVQCNAGSHVENGVCVPDQIQCNAGYHVENGACVPDQVNPGEHRVEISGGETHTSFGGETNTDGNQVNEPANIPSTPVNVPSTPVNVPSANPSGEHRVEISGGETHTSGNSGGDNNQCDAGYHLENGKCVPDQ